MLRIFCRDLLKSSRIRVCTCRLSNSPRKQPAARADIVGRTFLLLCPITCFGLAYWQVQRKKWKEDLIEQLEKKFKMQPLELPTDLSELKDLELCPVKVRGTFDYTNEVYIGPKSDTIDKDSGQSSGLAGSRATGVHVITPFKLSDRDLTILINRGWYENDRLKSKEALEKGQVHGEQEIVGVVRLDQDTSAMFWKFLSDFDRPEKRHGKDVFCVRKIDTIAKRCGSAPVFLDGKMVKKSPFEPKPVPVAAELRNTHFIYVMTWLGLGVILLGLWYTKYNAPARTTNVSAYISKQNAIRQGRNQKS